MRDTISNHLVKPLMKQSITNNLWCLALGFSLLLCGHGARADFDARWLNDDVLLIASPDGNTLVAVDTDGLILVDGVPASQAQDYLDYVRKTTGHDNIKILINTHWHPEVTGLNDALGQAGVPILAHDNTKHWLAATIRQRGATIIHTPVVPHALPSATLHERDRLPFRNGHIEMGYLLQAHTDGDLYVRFPDHNLLYTGGVIRSDGWNVVDDTTNGFIGGLMDAFTTLEPLIDDATLIVPASGPLMDQAAFNDMHTMYKEVMAEMVSLLRQAKSIEEVVSINPVDGLRPEWGDPSDFLAQGFRSFYSHLRDTRHVGVMP